MESASEKEQISFGTTLKRQSKSWPQLLEGIGKEKEGGGIHYELLGG